MPSSHKAAENAAWIIGCRILRAVLNLLITILTARALGPSQFGLLHYAISLTAFALPVMQLGFQGILVRELLENPEEEGKILGTSLAACSFSAIFSIMGLLLFALWANAGERLTIVICGLYSLTLLAQAWEMILYWFQAHLLSRYSALASLGTYVFTCIFRLLLLLLQKKVLWFAASAVLEQGLTAMALLLIYGHLGGQRLSVSLTVLKKLWHSGKYCILSGLMAAVYVQMDTVMLKAFLGREATGYYSAAAACAGMTAFFFAAILDSGAPVIYESHRKSIPDSENKMTGLYSLILFFSLSQSLVLTVFADPVIRLLYGEGYAPAGKVLQVLIWYTVFSYLGAAKNIWLLAEGKQRLLAEIDLTGAVLNVILNALMIPKLGIFGAAAASFLTQMVTNVFLVLMRKETRKAALLMGRALDPRVLIQCMQSLQSRKEN